MIITPELQQNIDSIDSIDGIDSVTVDEMPDFVFDIIGVDCVRFTISGSGKSYEMYLAKSFCVNNVITFKDEVKQTLVDILQVSFDRHEENIAQVIRKYFDQQQRRLITVDPGVLVNDPVPELLNVIQAISNLSGIQSVEVRRINDPVFLQLLGEETYLFCCVIPLPGSQFEQAHHFYLSANKINNQADVDLFVDTIRLYIEK